MLFDATALGRELLGPLGPVLDELDGAVGRADRSLVGHHRRWIDVAGHETGGIATQVGDHLRHLLRACDAHECGAPLDLRADGVGDPPGVGHRRVHHVGGDAEAGQLRRCGQRVALERALGRAVRHLLGKAVRTARRESDDATPFGAAGDVPAGELGDHQRGALRVTARFRSMVPALTGRVGRPNRSTADGSNGSCTHPVVLFTTMSTGPSCVRRAIQEPRRCVGVAVGFEREAAGIGVAGVGVVATRRYVDSTRAPRAASARVVAAPIPWFAPVTIAT